jgi:hypothetical protein
MLQLRIETQAAEAMAAVRATGAGVQSPDLYQIVGRSAENATVSPSVGWA